MQTRTQPGVALANLHALDHLRRYRRHEHFEPPLWKPAGVAERERVHDALAWVLRVRHDRSRLLTSQLAADVAALSFDVPAE